MPGCAHISVNEAAVSADSSPCKIQKILSQMSLWGKANISCTVIGDIIQYGSTIRRDHGGLGFYDPKNQPYMSYTKVWQHWLGIAKPPNYPKPCLSVHLQHL